MRPDISNHERGVGKCEESVRKACECSRIELFFDWLDSGKMLEKSLLNGTSITFEVYRGI